MDRLLSKVKKHFNDDHSQDADSATTNLRAPDNLFRFASNHPREGLLEGRGDEVREVRIAKVEELGDVVSLTSNIKRDLGFQGRLGNRVVLSYGDTLWGPGDTFRGMSSNSAAIACDDPTQVFDSDLQENSYPQALLLPDKKYDEEIANYALGITNVVEVSPDRGILYFLLNHRPEGNNHILGAGVAEVTIDNSPGYPVPRARRLSRFWWDAETEPWYGDCGVLKVEHHIYAYGHAKDNPWVFLTRVPAEKAFDLEAYEYWNGDDWQKERLKGSQLGDKEKVFWQVNQGQIIWSPFHRRFLFIYCDNFWSCQALIKTAEAPEGPWSDAITVHKPKPVQEGGNIYAAIPHPYFDPSGKTLIITYTNHPNTIQAIRVEFG